MNKKIYIPILLIMITTCATYADENAHETNEINEITAGYAAEPITTQKTMTEEEKEEKKLTKLSGQLFEAIKNGKDKDLETVQTIEKKFFAKILNRVNDHGHTPQEEANYQAEKAQEKLNALERKGQILRPDIKKDLQKKLTNLKWIQNFLSKKEKFVRERQQELATYKAKQEQINKAVEFEKRRIQIQKEVQAKEQARKKAVAAQRARQEEIATEQAQQAIIRTQQEEKRRAELEREKQERKKIEQATPEEQSALLFQAIAKRNFNLIKGLNLDFARILPMEKEPGSGHTALEEAIEQYKAEKINYTNASPENKIKIQDNLNNLKELVLFLKKVDSKLEIRNAERKWQKKEAEEEKKWEAQKVKRRQIALDQKKEQADKRIQETTCEAKIQKALECIHKLYSNKNFTKKAQRNLRYLLEQYDKHNRYLLGESGDENRYTSQAEDRKQREESMALKNQVISTLKEALEKANENNVNAAVSIIDTSHTSLSFAFLSGFTEKEFFEESNVLNKTPIPWTKIVEKIICNSDIFDFLIETTSY